MTLDDDGSVVVKIPPPRMVAVARFLRERGILGRELMEVEKLYAVQ